MSNRKFREACPQIFFILLFFLVFNPHAGQAGAPFVETGSITGKINLVPYAEYLPDHDGSLELEDIFSSRHHEKFLPLSKGIPLSEAGALWLRFTLAPAKGSANSDSFFLDLGKRIPEGSAVYTPKDVRPVSTGPSVWNLRRATPDKMFKIPPASPDGPTSIYIRIPATPDIWFAPVLFPVTHAGEMGDGVVYYLSMGLLGLLVALCLFRAFRDSGEWRLWTGVLAAMVLAQQLLQTPALPLGFSYYSAALLYLLVPSLGLALMPHVARHLWNTPSSGKKLDKALNILCIAGGMLPLCLLIPGLAWTARLLPLWPALAVFCCIAAVPAIRGRLPGAGRYFMGMLLLSAGGLLTLLAQTTNNPDGILLNAPVWAASLTALLLGVLPMRSPVSVYEETSSPLAENQDDTILLLSDVLDAGSIPETASRPETAQYSNAEDILLKALSGETCRNTGEKISLSIPADNATESQNQFPQTAPELTKEKKEYSHPLSMQASGSIQPLPSEFFNEDALSLVSAPRPLSIKYKSSDGDEKAEPAELPELRLNPADETADAVKEDAPYPTSANLHSDDATPDESDLMQNNNLEKTSETKFSMEKQETEVHEPEPEPAQPSTISESVSHEPSETETAPIYEAEQAGTDSPRSGEAKELQTDELTAPTEDVAAAETVNEEKAVQNWPFESPDAAEQSSLTPQQEDASDINPPCLQAANELKHADEDAAGSSVTGPETALESDETCPYSGNKPGSEEGATDPMPSRSKAASLDESESASPDLTQEADNAPVSSDAIANSDETALPNAAEKLVTDALPVLKIPFPPEQDAPEENDNIAQKASEATARSECEMNIDEAEQAKLQAEEIRSTAEAAECSQTLPADSSDPIEAEKVTPATLPSPAEKPLSLNIQKQEAGHTLQMPEATPAPEPQLKPGFFSRFRQSPQRRQETSAPAAARRDALHVSDRPGGSATRLDPLILSKIEETLKIPLESLMQAVSKLNNCSLPPLARVQAEAISKSGNALAEIIGSLGRSQMQEDTPGAPGADKAAQESIFDLQVILREAHDAVAPKAERCGLALSWFMPPHLPLLYKGNPAQLLDVLRLLLDSAIESTGKGSVQVTVRRVPDSTNPGHLVFSVTDAGETSPHMRRSTTALMKAWEMVVDQGGTLSIDSTPNQATVVSFTLHLSVPGKQLNQLFSLSGEKGQMRPLSILAADEQATNRQLISFFLNDLPYLIEEARSADEALSRYMENPAGLVIFDEGLPGLDLPTFINKLHEIDASQNIPPVPVLTLTKSQAGEEQALAAGSRAVISKPLSRSQVRDSVKALLPIPEEALEAIKPTGIPLSAPDEAETDKARNTASASDTVSPVQNHTESEVSFISSGAIAEIIPEPRVVADPEPEQPKAASVSRSLASLAMRFIKIRPKPQPHTAVEAEAMQSSPDVEGERTGLREESGVSDAKPLSAGAANAPEPEEAAPAAASPILEVMDGETAPDDKERSPSVSSLEEEKEESAEANSMQEPAGCPSEPISSELDAAATDFSSPKPMPESEGDSPEGSSEKPESEQEDKIPAEPEILPASQAPEAEAELAAPQKAETVPGGAPELQESAEAAPTGEISSEDVNPLAEEEEAEAALTAPSPEPFRPAWDASLPIAVEGDEVDPEVIHLIPGLLDNLEHALADARLGLENRSFLGVSEACMRIAGTADAHGLRTLKNIANCVERAANANDMEAVSDLLNELGGSIESTRSSLEAVYREYTGSSSI
ncbi:MAG: response regulator [Desulfovibrionaceae bacterium]|nr:response regulator [Desulfovibrionaceae bacterium]